MYTQTPTHRFLVLSAPESTPAASSHRFLVLSPTESGPDPRAWEDQSSQPSPSNQSPTMGPSSLHRTSRALSTSSVDSQLNEPTSTSPSDFLYLGHSRSKIART
ncbi:hypothetical protein N7474_004882 [Penicillium riverlandense]|uniref:uncharacterized protein n=1 Tax=Penicillium riverlandense TaxID=1903569 RepID=UPI002547E3B1|nr:uncharacterized protein N7474_004882 [Penicillium riverlandense]KAJ5819291.1 hypothetical protein N7474_004882 [Penicillium riverlandense]